MADLEINVQIARNTPEPTNAEAFEAYRAAVQTKLQSEWPGAEVSVTSGGSFQATVNVNGGGFDDMAISDALPGLIDAAWTEWAATRSA